MIELPTWLGDVIMTTPSIENLIQEYEDAEIILLGNSMALEVFKENPRVKKLINIKKGVFNFFYSTKNLERVDYFLSFRSSFGSHICKYLVKAEMKFSFQKKLNNTFHQVEKYNLFVSSVLNFKSKPGPLKIYHQTTQEISKSLNPQVGINPGAKYGSAKKWTIEGFVDVSKSLSKNYDVKIFGGKAEIDITNKIYEKILNKGVVNATNYGGKTNLRELINEISKLDLFITGDSGPMHIAAAFNIPTIAIFGPTNSIETCQWQNKKSYIVKENLECQPCMKRECPLSHHKCMKNIKAGKVLKAIESLC